MHIAPDRIVQLVESEPPTLVLMDTATGAEITLTAAATALLADAVDYYADALGLTRTHSGRNYTAPP